MTEAKTYSISLPFTPADKQELKYALNVFVCDKKSAIETYGNIDTWITTNVTDMSYLFTGLNQIYTFNNIDDIISNWDTSNVTNMCGFFTATNRFNQPLFWNTSNVKDMSFLFCQCEQFNQTLHWDTSSVQNMRMMFFYCQKFNMPLYFSDLSNVENMDDMFAFCDNLRQNYSNWNIQNVANYKPLEMFKRTPNIYRKTNWPSKKEVLSSDRDEYIDPNRI